MKMVKERSKEVTEGDTRNVVWTGRCEVRTSWLGGRKTRGMYQITLFFFGYVCVHQSGET